jgi:tRNA pseudouridine38-40 synthase
MQVVHFDVQTERTERGWVMGTNTRLPTEVSALWARVVPDGFHARYGALARSYRYLILNRAARPALNRNRMCWVRESLDADRMHEAAQHFVGEHDFSSFRAAECQSKTPMRRLYAISVERHGEVIAIAVTANAFLHHMVRNIAGVLIAVGRGEQGTEWPRELLSIRDRTQGGVTAPAQGLYLIGVKYAEALQLPSELQISKDW